MGTIARRDFLKAASVAAACAGAARRGGEARARGDVRIAGRRIPPIQEYPIRPKPHSRSRSPTGSGSRRSRPTRRSRSRSRSRKLSETERGFAGNVLEAAMLSLKTHPDPACTRRSRRASKRSRDRKARARRGARASAARGNGGFEVAATYYRTTGKRDLLDRAIAAADALYQNFVEQNLPFSGGERDAINCVQLYLVTPRQEASRSGEALSRHPRPREFRQPQPAQPVVQAGARAERSGRTRGELRVADGVARRRRAC